MKKNMVKVALVAVVGLIAGINVFNAQKSHVLSVIALANVEALASDSENTGTSGDCKNSSGYKIWYLEPDPTLNIGAERNQKRGFNDCCGLRAEGYLPSGSCI